MDDKITDCEIIKGATWKDSDEIFITINNIKESLFNYFSDEISFSESEFIGKNKEEALAIIHAKYFACLAK
jgi:hypothetical protein